MAFIMDEINKLIDDRMKKEGMEDTPKNRLIIVNAWIEAMKDETHHLSDIVRVNLTLEQVSLEIKLLENQ